ncbi:uncharacterized protein LOC143809306 isoform X1 [Ranitomeya variabilis]|uniref:uncharacterized protein LOC143809306 isoform X1 n=1 Tax=Ranitomeya variabilis TaxID=490064 RepID=UPI0040566DA8
MSAVLEELLGKVRAAALVRGEAWLQEKVAEIVADEGKASDAQDASPCAKRVRSLGPRSPSPVPRNHLKVSSPGRDPPEVAAGQCPSSEVPCPSENPFSLDTDLWNEDLRIPLNAASRHGSDSGLKSEDAGIVSEEEQKSSRDSGQCYSSPSPNPRTDKAETCHSCSNGKDPNMTHSNNTEEEPIELRIERLLQSCSATIMQDQQEEEPSEPTPVSSSVPEAGVSAALPAAEPGEGTLTSFTPDASDQHLSPRVQASVSSSSWLRHDLHPCLVWILGDSLVASALEKVSLVPDGRQLGFPLSKAIIQWLGFSSLTWDSVTPTVTRYSCLDRPPDILVIHAGGDDLYSGVSIMDLIGNIKFDIFKLKSLFPGVEIVWSQIVKRYKCPQAKNHKPFKFACKKINKQLTNYQRCKKTKWAVVVRHMDLEGDVAHLFEKDGAHLNSAGNKIWCRDIQEGIEKALQRWHHPGNSQG